MPESLFPPATLLQKRPWHWCFPVNFVKFLRTPFLTEDILLLLVLSLDTHVYVRNVSLSENFVQVLKELVFTKPF